MMSENKGTKDAKFEDGAEQAVSLKAYDADGLLIISTLIQDAVFPVAQIQWRAQSRVFAVLLNRFRWEDVATAQSTGRELERVQSLLVVSGVLSVSSKLLAQGESDRALSVLSVAFIAGEGGAGRLDLTLADGAVIALSVECLDVVLKDVTRPYIARVQKVPSHF